MEDTLATICRICLSTDEKPSYPLVIPETRKLFNAATSITLLPEGKYLLQICPKCYSRCKDILEFQLQCLDSHSKIHDMIENHHISVKKEVVEVDDQSMDEQNQPIDGPQIEEEFITNEGEKLKPCRVIIERIDGTTNLQEEKDVQKRLSKRRDSNADDNCFHKKAKLKEPKAGTSKFNNQVLLSMERDWSNNCEDSFYETCHFSIAFANDLLDNTVIKRVDCFLLLYWCRIGNMELVMLHWGMNEEDLSRDLLNALQLINKTTEPLVYPTTAEEWNVLVQPMGETSIPGAVASMVCTVHQVKNVPEEVADQYESFALRGSMGLKLLVIIRLDTLEIIFFRSGIPAAKNDAKIFKESQFGKDYYSHVLTLPKINYKVEIPLQAVILADPTFDRSSNILTEFGSKHPYDLAEKFNTALTSDRGFVEHPFRTMEDKWKVLIYRYTLELVSQVQPFIVRAYNYHIRENPPKRTKTIPLTPHEMMYGLVYQGEWVAMNQDLEHIAANWHG